MAKDDYFVIVYRILNYLYKCFKAVETAEREAITPDALGINSGYYANILESLLNEGYITGVDIIPMCGTIGVKILNIKITQKGIEFLQENSLIAKARRYLKEAKDIIPGI